MATPKNKNKLAALFNEICEDYPRSNMAQNSTVPRSQDYIPQISEESEGRVTKKLSQEFRITENRILGALARLDEFFMNPLLHGHSRTTPETSRNALITSQGTNEDDSQSDPHPEASFLHKQTTDNSGPEGGHDKVTGVHEEVTYCSPTKFAGKQKKNPSTSRPQFRSENTPATIEADQNLLALQRLANNHISANFHNNINRISKFPKSLTSKMPRFDGTSEKFELFEDLFQTSLKFHNQLTEDDRINYIHSLMMGGGALQTFENINRPTRENLREILEVFRRKYVKPLSMATAKHKFQKLAFNPANQKLVDFLDELQKLAKDAFGKAAHAIIEQLLYAKMPPHLKKSINQAHLENGTYEQIVRHLEKVLELNGLEAPDELQINTVSQQPLNTTADRPKPTCHDCKKPGHYRNQCRLLEKQREQTESNQNNPVTKNSEAKNSNVNSNVNMIDSNNNNNKNSKRAEKSRRNFTQPVTDMEKTNHSTEKCYFGANAANRPPLRHRRPERQSQVPERANGSDSNEVPQAAAQNLNNKCHVFTPELQLTDLRQLI